MTFAAASVFRREFTQYTEKNPESRYVRHFNHLTYNQSKYIHEKLTDCPSSELLLHVHLHYVHNLSIFDTIPASMFFITLRSPSVNLYCQSTMKSMTGNSILSWTDRTSLFVNKQSALQIEEEDQISNIYQRCGTVGDLNMTQICANSHCHCHSYQ
jgi:hypothetical protein